MRVADIIQRMPLGQELPDQPVDVLATGALPRAMRITEEHLNARSCRQTPMFGHLAALVIGQGGAEGRRYRPQRLPESPVGTPGIVPFQLEQADVAAAPLIQDTHGLRGLGLADDQIAFPVSGGEPVQCFGRALGDALFDPAAAAFWLKGSASQPLPTSINPKRFTSRWHLSQSVPRTVSWLILVGLVYILVYINLAVENCHED